ncbi:hypothetical protein, partial [Mycoplasmopsis gallopavonis]|uniref:hypothetical protein n=1 Tax=Mycoplasmopsis gallopavonis TaxID=76629 RepID=UPI001C726E84
NWYFHFSLILCFFSASSAIYPFSVELFLISLQIVDFENPISLVICSIESELFFKKILIELSF